jgi:hypothetical protein
VRGYEVDATSRVHDSAHLNDLQQAVFAASADVDYDTRRYDVQGAIWVIRKQNILYLAPLATAMRWCVVVLIECISPGPIPMTRATFADNALLPCAEGGLLHAGLGSAMTLRSFHASPVYSFGISYPDDARCTILLYLRDRFCEPVIMTIMAAIRTMTAPYPQ